LVSATYSTGDAAAAGAPEATRLAPPLVDAAAADDDEDEDPLLLGEIDDKDFTLSGRCLCWPLLRFSSVPWLDDDGVFLLAGRGICMTHFKVFEPLAAEGEAAPAASPAPPRRLWIPQAADALSF
jgi:hypothetical protein